MSSGHRGGPQKLRSIGLCISPIQSKATWFPYSPSLPSCPLSHEGVLCPWEEWEVWLVWVWHVSIVMLPCTRVFSAYVGSFQSTEWLQSLACHSGNTGCWKPLFKDMLYCFRWPKFYFTFLVNIFQLLSENFGKTAPTMQLKNHPAETLRSSA